MDTKEGLIFISEVALIWIICGIIWHISGYYIKVVPTGAGVWWLITDILTPILGFAYVVGKYA